MAASRTMSPSRASEGGDCTTLRSQAGWGRGAPRAAMCSLPRPPGGVCPPPRNNPQPARPRREMASPSHTSGRSPLKESGPAHPQFANCPACAAKWTRPPGAGWAPGASRGRSSGSGSVLAVKKTSTLNGRLLPPRPDSPGAPPLRRVVPSEPPELRAREPSLRQRGARTRRLGPCALAAAAAVPCAGSRPRLALGRRGLRRRGGGGERPPAGPRTPGRPRSLPRPRPCPLASPPGPGLPAWLSRTTPGAEARGAGLRLPPTPSPAGPSEGSGRVSSLNLLQKDFLPGILTRRHDP